MTSYKPYVNELGVMYFHQHDFYAATRERDEARAELAKVNREKYPFVHLRFDVSGAEVESALRAKLIELGWTPPADLPAPSAAPAVSEPKPDYTCECGYMAAWPICTKCGKPTEAGAGPKPPRPLCDCKFPQPAPFNREWCYACGCPLRLVEQQTYARTTQCPVCAHSVIPDADGKAQPHADWCAAPSPAQPESGK